MLSIINRRYNFTASLVHAIVHGRISAHLIFRRNTVCKVISTAQCLYHIQRIQCLEPADMGSWLGFCRWINSNPNISRNILFNDEVQFTRDGVNNTRNFYLWDRDNKYGTVESNYQYRSSSRVWCGVIGDQLIVPYIFPQCLTSLTLCNMNCQQSSENVPVQTRRQIYYQHDGTQPHFSQVVRQSFFHSVFCLTTGPKPPLKRFHHIVRSTASSFK